MRDTAREPEEVIVRPYEWEPSMVPSAEFMQQVYDLRGLGACLYVKGRYEEAFPYLQAAARKGFKLAQARLAFLYQQGLGTERDPYAAIGWYAVAATGTTLPEIRNGFRKIWRRIPDEHRPAVSTLVDEYKDKFGASRHRVECDLSDRAGTYLKTLTCRFRDEGILVDHGRMVYSLSREWFLD
ncbi:MAG: sel1 repeat family protein, partial [Pseudomonadales bacterium]|nr:sel1 repeat family protein [Pseudomonadales bacterium]